MSFFSPSKGRRRARSSKTTQNRAQEYLRRYQLDAVFATDKSYVDHKKKGPTGISHGRWVQQGKNIGEGAQGTVWKQKKVLYGIETQQVRAVKKIEVNILEKDIFSVRARRELNLLMSVQNGFQDLFVRCHGWFYDGSFLYIAMDFHEHGDLKTYLEKIESGPLGEDDSRKLTRQILRGLVVLHSHNICHRDIKPANILIASLLPLRVKITDFGISSLSDAERGTQTAPGSFIYAAPEQSQGKICTTAVDMWSLGCVVYELLTFDTPFNERKDFQAVDWKAKSLGVSDIARDFLRKLVAIDPSSRMDATMAFQHQWIYVIDTEERALWYGSRRSILNPHWGELSTV